MKLIHISDIHLHGDAILGSDPVERFRLCMDHVEQHHSDADMVVITGDLTHRGQRSSYETLKSLLDDWSIKPLLMIGNHDHRPTFLDVFPHVETDSNGYVQYSRQTDLGRFLYLDTMEPGTHSGHYGPDRLGWLNDQLAQAESAGEGVWLFMHHNPVDVGVFNADTVGLVDGDAFRDALRPHRNRIRHIFFGHCHYILSGSVCGIPFSAPRSTNHPCVPDFTGRDRMGFGPLPPTYNVCLLSSDACVIHSVDFLEAPNVKWLAATPDGWIHESDEQQS